MTPTLVIYSAAVAGLALFGLHRLGLLLLYFRVRNQRTEASCGDQVLPQVTVQLPVYNERHVAGRLLMAAARMDYPRDLLEIQVLDDSTDDTQRILERLCRRLRRLDIDVHHIHRADRRGYKAGALEAGLAQARGEIVAVFDADFVPPTDFLRRIVRPFSDPKVGMVQARWGHLNRESSLLTQLQAIFLDGHFHIEHVARSRTGRFFNFNGTAGAWRKVTIEEAGGWQHDTLTEDLDLSYRAQMAGWRFEYLEDLETDAELPVDMNAFKAQQHRWAKGSVQTARKLLPRVLHDDLPWRVKLEALFHLTNNLTYLLMLIPVLLWVPTLKARTQPDEPWMIALAVAMGMTTLCVLAYHITCQRAAGRSMRETIAVLPALLSLGIGLSVNNGRAVIEALVGHESPFVRTPKYGVGAGAIDGDMWRSLRQSWRYAAAGHWLTWVELAFAVYFAFGVAFAISNERFVAVPFLLLFMVGFAYVGLSSLGQRVDRLLSTGSLAAGGALLGFAVWASGVWAG